MVYCCAKNCHSIYVPGGGITFHSFPSNLNLKAQWVSAANLEHINITSTHALCSKHFAPECFHNTNMLDKNAVPTIFETDNNETVQVSENITESTPEINENEQGENSAPVQFLIVKTPNGGTALLRIARADEIPNVPTIANNTSNSTDSSHTEAAGSSSFPLHNKQLCQSWVSAVNKPNWEPKKYSKVCSEHFRSTDYERQTTRDTPRGPRQIKFLKKGAVPTLKLPGSNLSKEQTIWEDQIVSPQTDPLETNESNNEPQIVDSTVPENNGVGRSPILKSMIKKNFAKFLGKNDSHNESTVTENEETVTENEETDSDYEDKPQPKLTRRKRFVTDTRRPRIFNPRFPGDFTERDLKSPEKMRKLFTLAQKKILEQSKKLKTLQQKNRRVEGQVTRLKNLVKHLKSVHR